MKMSPELYRELENAIWPRLPPIRYGPSTMRQRWDFLWASGYDVNKLYKAGLNDDHIDTALRTITR